MFREEIPCRAGDSADRSRRTGSEDDIAFVFKFIRKIVSREGEVREKVRSRRRRSEITEVSKSAVCEVSPGRIEKLSPERRLHWCEKVRLIIHHLVEELNIMCAKGSLAEDEIEEVECEWCGPDPTLHERVIAREPQESGTPADVISDAPAGEEVFDLTVLDVGFRSVWRRGHEVFHLADSLAMSA